MKSFEKIALVAFSIILLLGVLVICKPLAVQGPLSWSVAELLALEYAFSHPE